MKILNDITINFKRRDNVDNSGQPSFHRQTQPINTPNDVFVRSEKPTEKSQAKDIQSLLVDYEAKTRKLPMIMDDICLYIGKYVSSDIPAERFSTLYLSRLPNLYKRIETGTEHEEYSASYKNEIEMIKTVAKAVAAYSENQTTEEEDNLNRICVKAISDYVEKRSSRTKDFVL